MPFFISGRNATSLRSFLLKLSFSVLEIGFVEVCGFEFEGFKQRRILKILRQTVDFSGSKALIAQICDELFSV